MFCKQHEKLKFGWVGSYMYRIHIQHLNYENYVNMPQDIFFFQDHWAIRVLGIGEYTIYVGCLFVFLQIVQ